jgi:hypothetical protein
VPIWISPPAKVARQTIIQQIINDINTVKSVDDLGFDSSYYDFFSTIESDGNSVLIVTPGDLKLQVGNGTVSLIDQSLQPFAWQDLIEMQGELRESSRIQLNLSDNAESEDQLVTGTVTALPEVPNSLVFNLDPETLPSNSFADVDRIIDPREVQPGNGLNAAVLGQRYLIVEDMLSTTFAEWNLSASANDIIEYNGTNWVVSFNSSEITTVQFVENAFTSQQFKWDGSQWISSWQGTYNPGYWRLLL